MDEAPASSARVTPRASADWFRGLDKFVAPQNIFMAVLTPAGSGAGRIRFQPVAKVPGLPGEPRFD
jgi:hypothetical protein